MAAEWKKSQEESERKATAAMLALREQYDTSNSQRATETSAYLDAIADFKALYEREQSLRAQEAALRVRR
jgi:hypothetical protein